MEQKKNNDGTLLTVTGQKRLTFTGARSVDGFTDAEVKISLPEGGLTVSGKGLKITEFSEETGVLGVSGVIFSVRYAAGREPFFRRIFK